MFGRETWMLLRHYLEHGETKGALARRLGVSRDTIRRWIRDGDLHRGLETTAVQYGPRPPVATKLTPYRAIVEARIAAYPQLSAVRLLEEIRAAGYTGGYTQLKAFVHARFGRAPCRPPSSASRRRRGARRRSTSRGFASHGASATRSWSSSATRGCCGATSTGARTCGRYRVASRRRFCEKLEQREPRARARGGHERSKQAGVG